MDLLHALNLAVHIGAGAAGIALGLLTLAMAKGTARHRSSGRRFAICVLIVCAAATVGSIVFRFIPVFALLTVLVLYQLVSGWRSVYTRAAGPALLDAAWTLAAALAVALLLPALSDSTAFGGDNRSVILATLGGIATALAYDTLRWCFPRHWFARLWVYDHIYKLIASFAALLSAFAGNTLQQWQPWSQILPSVLGGSLIVLFVVRQILGEDGARN